MNNSNHPQAYLLYLFLFLSGFAGLGYEMVWTRMLSVGLGHEIVAVLAVVAAFFSGMALGSFSLDGSVSRSSRPGRWYAALEAVVGIWSLALIALIPWANRAASYLMGPEPTWARQWFFSFFIPFVLLLPATFAMGGTLPAMERLFSRLRRNGWSVGGLYGVNTLGAVAGTVINTFISVPHLGFSLTLVLLASANFLCAAGVLLGAARNEKSRLPVNPDIPLRPSEARLYITLFLTGLLGIGYEVLVVRAFSQVLENTVYSFASVLSVYLLGTAFGAWLYQIAAPRRDFDRILAVLLQALSTACLLGTLLLVYSESIYESVRIMAGGGFSGSVMSELALAFSVFFVPTLFMGATFSHLGQYARGHKRGLGHALALNTLGASFAPFVFCVVLLPAIGFKLILILVSAGYLFLLPSFRRSRWRTAAVPSAFAVILLFSPLPFRFVTLPPGERIVAHREGVMAAVTVTQDGRKDYHLKVNNKFQMGGTSSFYSDRRQGHIPLLLHPCPQKALFLGLGTGATFAAAASHPGLEGEGVELIPEIIPLLKHFEKSTGGLMGSDGLHIKVADARRFVNASTKKYDVIVADLFHPARDGAGSLYTAEHFSSIRSRLNSGGIFCQWLPLYQMDLGIVRVIVRTFLQVFPEGKAYLAHFSLQTPILGLIAGTGPIALNEDWMSHRVNDPALYRELKALRLHDSFALFGCFLAGPEELEQFAGSGPINTDDHPVVIFEAPRFVYSQQDPAYVRLLGLIDRFEPKPEHLFDRASTDSDRRMHSRLLSYWAARNNFIHAGIGITPTRDLRTLLGSIREPLLEIVRQSPEFEAAYNPLIAMAQSLHQTDPKAAEELLFELEEVNPQRDDARRLREYLSK
jgi:spermidine synthase